MVNAKFKCVPLQSTTWQKPRNMSFFVRKGVESPKMQPNRLANF